LRKIKDNKQMNLKEHWNNVYLKSPEDKLGWYEMDVSATIRLVSKTDIPKNDRILIVGAGSTTLIEELLSLDYNNLIATDISEIALKKLAGRINSNKVDFVVDDLTSPVKLRSVEPVDLWIDRAVLHFFTEQEDQDAYFELLKSTLKPNGFVLLAEFNIKGATKCAGLPIHRYSLEMMMDKLGAGFELLESFDYTYISPSGGERPYIYALFKRNT
jgi:SAM-dependent methyltransferase